MYSVLNSHPLCSVRMSPDTTYKICMESLERFCPRISRVINHKIGNLTSNRVLSSENRPVTLYPVHVSGRGGTWIVRYCEGGGTGIFGVFAGTGVFICQILDRNL